MIVPALCVAAVAVALVAARPAHAHRCACCGARWEHRGLYIGEDAIKRAHVCPNPKCRRVQYMQDTPAGAPAIS